LPGAGGGGSANADAIEPKLNTAAQTAATMVRFMGAS
jgi:hypothetical protein